MKSRVRRERKNGQTEQELRDTGVGVRADAKTGWSGSSGAEGEQWLGVWKVKVLARG